jgi:hypothetical protein
MPAQAADATSTTASVVTPRAIVHVPLLAHSEATPTLAGRAGVSRMSDLKLAHEDTTTDATRYVLPMQIAWMQSHSLTSTAEPTSAGAEALESQIDEFSSAGLLAAAASSIAHRSVGLTLAGMRRLIS